MRCINKIVNVFSICTEKYCLRSKYQPSLRGYVTCAYCLYMLKTHQWETKLFKFSQNTNWEELKIKRGHFVIAFCNGTTSLVFLCFSMFFYVFVLPSLVYKQTYHLSWGRTILENIGQSSRTSALMKIQY